MKFIISFFLFSSALLAQINFENYFFNKTMRFDYFHSGNSKEESFSFDEIIEEPYWGGSHINLIDNFEYGYFLFKVFDDASNKLIYSRGYSTLFQEWQTTAEADEISRTMSESLVFPFPKNKVRVEIFRRDKKNIFQKKFTYVIDPANYFIKKERKYIFPSKMIHNSGEPSEKLDIVIIPDGYTKNEMEKFRKDCLRTANNLFEYSPFSENKNNINIWAVEAPSEESGTDIPAYSIWKSTILNTSFYTFDSERYLMTDDYKMVRNIAANAPYDQIYIMVNTEKYGGGSIYNYYNCTAADNKMTKQIFVHEFGHGFAGLADEYYTSDVSYEDYYPLDVEPWEANITTLVDFDSKWKDMVDKDLPVPTPNENTYGMKTGVFEGGGYVAKGVYRPTYDSIMKSFASNEFNEVCKRTITNLIKFYSK